MGKIIIGADLVPTRSNENLFREGNIKALLGEGLLEILSQAEFCIFNLEVPLTDKGSPISKHGPNLSASTDVIQGLKNMNPYFFSLANNHILDQGEEGLYSTLNILDKVGISHAGAGENLRKAQEPHKVKVNGVIIGIYCCTEHEFTIASENHGGANPFDPLESLDHVAALKEQCDYVIALYHGGKEHYRYPSPLLQKTCRKLIDKGADLVVCQHSHCIGCEEKWGNGTIIYGQGNFLFDGSENECWQTGLLIELIPSKRIDVMYHPIVKKGNVVRLAEKDKATEILSDFVMRSEEIKDPATIELKYNEFSKKMLDTYLSQCMGKSNRNIVYRAVNKISGYKFMSFLAKARYGKQERLALENMIECEAHRELWLRGMRSS